MAQLSIDSLEQLQETTGKTLGPSDWREVTQDMIDAFAEVSGDHQWIHTDVERAKNDSPFGTTIAHGNLTLSMADGFRAQLLSFSGFQLGVNYGWNKVRYPAPVPTGSRVRGTAETLSVKDLGGGWYELIQRLTVEVEDLEKPAFVGESVVRFLA
ncbi:MAG: dehydratase [Nitriliruptorales bacterium]|nr:dehydratase [Nitriliruptorales bacterium]